MACRVGCLCAENMAGVHDEVREYFWRIALDKLGDNLEVAGIMAVFGQARYAKGFTDGTLLREFCEDYVPETYFPTADSRPKAERLGWSPLS